MSIDLLKDNIRQICKKYPAREERSRRIFIEERASCMQKDREREFEIKTAVSNRFSVPYASIAFCGSGQIGFSVHKDTLFRPMQSDLDVACINADLFQFAWTDIAETTRGFTDESRFTTRRNEDIQIFKEQIYKRGMIRIDAMPQSKLSLKWTDFQNELGRKHRQLFKSVTIAIYMNEYAFCLKQDTAIATILRET